MAQRTCAFCLRPAKRKYCIRCLPPFGEWPDPGDYHRRYSALNSVLCGRIVASRLATKKRLQPRPAETGPCRVCGQNFDRSSPNQVYCSKECRLEQTRRTNRRKRREYRAKDERSRSVRWRYAVVLLLVERNGTTCGLCQLPIDMTLTHPDPWSATIDHILPVAAGGDEHPTNLQLAHFRCNIQKGKRESEFF